MPADGFQWLYGSNVKKLIKEAKEQKHIHRLQETGPFSKQTRWPGGRHRPQNAGPIDLRYRMAPGEKVGSEPEAVNAAIIDGAEVRVTDTESIKLMPGIKADNFDNFKTGGRDWKDSTSDKTILEMISGTEVEMGQLRAGGEQATDSSYYMNNKERKVYNELQELLRAGVITPSKCEESEFISGVVNR